MTWHPYVPGHLQSQQWPKFSEYKYSLYHALLTVKSNTFVIQQKRKYHWPRDIINQLRVTGTISETWCCLGYLQRCLAQCFFFSSLSAQAVMLMISLVLSSLMLNLIIASWVHDSLGLMIYWFTVLAVDELGKRWRFVYRSLAGGTFDENVTGCDWENLARYTTFIWGESVSLIWTLVTRMDWFMLTCDTKSFQGVTWILWLPWATNMSWTCKTLYDKVCGGETFATCALMCRLLSPDK